MKRYSIAVILVCGVLVAATAGGYAADSTDKIAQAEVRVKDELTVVSVACPACGLTGKIQSREYETNPELLIACPKCGTKNTAREMVKTHQQMVKKAESGSVK
jgi:predicted RNA-binding Zn-ribbon protein involved in translation (DUF1610 family)